MLVVEINLINTAGSRLGDLKAVCPVKKIAGIIGKSVAGIQFTFLQSERRCVEIADRTD